MSGSGRKKRYLEKEAKHQTPSRQLRASDLSPIAEHYKKKYGVSIIINGSTESGKEMVKKNRRQIQEKIDAYHDERTRWVQFAVDQGEYDYDDPRRKFFTIVQSELTAIGIELDPRKLKELPPAEYEKLNQILHDIFQKLNKMELVEGFIKERILELKKQKKDVGLDKFEVVQEIETLQKNLKEGESVGYIDTRGKMQTKGHMEVFIITPSKIIKPITWGRDYFQHPDLIDVHSMHAVEYDEKKIKKNEMVIPGTSFVFFTDPGVESIVLYAQSKEDPLVCGALSMLYLKELLKNNAELFKNTSFLLGSSVDKDVYETFIPAPEVLRYSQSEFFNKICHALMQDTDEVIIMRETKGRKYTVETLQKNLSEKFAQAQQEGNQGHITYYRQALDKLTALRPIWLAAYDEMKKKRDKFDIKYGQDDEALMLNRYLSYKSHHMKRIVRKETKEKDQQTAVKPKR